MCERKSQYYSQCVWAPSPMCTQAQLRPGIMEVSDFCATQFETARNSTVAADDCACLRQMSSTTAASLTCKLRATDTAAIADQYTACPSTPTAPVCSFESLAQPLGEMEGTDMSCDTIVEPYWMGTKATPSSFYSPPSKVALVIDVEKDTYCNCLRKVSTA